jgi:hypothetical protein
MSDDLTIPEIGKMSDDDARALLEATRWPNGPICPHCGVVGEATRMESRTDTKAENKMRAGLWSCRACREAFTVTVGTIFEGSHVPLSKWLMGFYLFATSKKSLSALQLQRQLGLGSYRTAWHLAHRIRHAMANGGPFAPMTGVVEVDETYVGGKGRNRVGVARHRKIPTGVPHRKAGRGTQTKVPVQVLVQRDGGSVRARVVPNVSAKTLQPYIREHVAKTAAIHSDEWPGYSGLGRAFAGGHHTVAHAHGEYARGNVHNNTAESFNGLFKRGFHGAWHNVSREHLNRYLDEFAYRWTHKADDAGDKMVRAVMQGDGVRLYYKRPKVGEGASARLVADG